MNAQPPEYIGPLLAAVFLAVMAWYAFKEYQSGNIVDLSKIDLVNIAFLDDQPVINILTNSSNSFESQQLYLDCIDALHSLGMKKSEAKKKAKMIFSTLDPQPKSVQEFLVIALKN